MLHAIEKILRNPCICFESKLVNENYITTVTRQEFRYGGQESGDSEKRA